jgi:GNAT superfamily N-acetyltransferase
MTLPFHLRPAVASDLDTILALERATDLAPHWPSSAYEDILKAKALGAPSMPRSGRNGWETSTHRCLFVAENNGSLIGFAVGLLHPGASSRIAELESIVVSANARRAGIGRSLCSAVLDWSRSQHATEVVLEVRANSIPAIALYTSLGFTLTARRPRYYRDPDDDALLLRLALL